MTAAFEMTLETLSLNRPYYLSVSLSLSLTARAASTKPNVQRSDKSWCRQQSVPRLLKTPKWEKTLMRLVYDLNAKIAPKSAGLRFNCK